MLKACGPGLHWTLVGVLASAVLASVGLAACGRPATADASSLAHPLELTWVRTLIQPDTSETTAWLGRPTKLQHDPVTGHLLALERDDQRIVEFTTEGRFLGSFGGRGGGPGELRNLLAFEIGADHVTTLDVGNGKLVIFNRDTREMVTEIRLQHSPRDITTIADTLLAVLPGPEGALFEFFHTDGRRLGSVGDGGFVGSSSQCVACSVTYLGEGLLVVLKPTVPEGRIYRLDGTMLNAFAFTELGHVLTEWREAFLENIRRAGRIVAAGGGGRISAGKIWLGKPAPISGGSFLVEAVPENPNRNPTEMWELDKRGRVTKRYVFDRSWMRAPTVFYPKTYTINYDGSFAIDEHLLPSIADNR